MMSSLDTLKAALGEKRGPMVFPRKLVDPTAAYLHDELELKTIEEVMAFGPDGFEAALGELEGTLYS